MIVLAKARLMLCLLLLPCATFIATAKLEPPFPAGGSAQPIRSKAQDSIPTGHNSIPAAEREVDIEALQWLRAEAAKLDALKAGVRGFLASKQIPITGARTSTAVPEPLMDAPSIRVVESREDNSINCRISLDRVPLGAKAVSPCRCSGTNEWVEFSVYNRMRRRDPEQWKACRTCGSPFASAAPLLERADPPARVLSFLLDHPPALRTLSALIILNMLRRLSAGVALRKAVVSKGFWMQYPNWARLAHLPLPMKIYLLKILGEQGVALLALAERRVVSELADVETALLEPTLAEHTLAANDF